MGDNRRTEKGDVTRQKIYDYIIYFFQQNGYAPSMRDICKGTGLKSTSSVYVHLTKLERDGKIKLDSNKTRAIKVNDYTFKKDRKK